MKIAVSSQGTSLDAWAGGAFGICSQFLVVDSESLDLVVVSVPPDQIDPSKVSLGAIRATDVQPNTAPKAPELVGRSVYLPRWNGKRARVTAGWRSDMGPDTGDAGCHLFCEDPSGQRLNQIDTCARFYPETRPYALLSHRDELLVLVTRQGFSLRALRTNPRNGAILGQVDYFD